MAGSTERDRGRTTHGRPPTIGVAVVGHGFMGAVHTHAWRNVARLFDVPAAPELVALAGHRREATRQAAAKLGYQSWEFDYRRLLDRGDVQIVDICTPNDSHAEIAIAALAAGKHVLCEKPLARTVAEAEAMALAAEKARASGVQAMTGFTYRRVPAIGLARRIVAAGRLGTLRHVRARYLQDWLVDPGFPMVWRMYRQRAGSGALGDLGAHIIDLAQFLMGQPINGVAGLTETFTRDRPALADDGRPDPASPRGEVTVDDAALFLARFDGGAVGTFESTRFALGRENQIVIEINGSQGSLGYDFGAINELQLWEGPDRTEGSGFRRIEVRADDQYVAKWWPPGHDYAFATQAFDFLSAIVAGQEPAPAFKDGLQIQRVMAAIEQSADRGAEWTVVPPPGARR